MAKLIEHRYEPYDYGFDEDGIYARIPFVS